MAEFSAQDLEKIIRTRFPAANDDIARIAIDLIMNDAANMKSRVAVTGSRCGHFKLLVSTRKPSSTTVQEEK